MEVEKVKRLKILLMYPFLVAVLTLSPYICIAYTQDIVEQDKTEQDKVIEGDDYNIKDLRPTRYPNLEQTEENAIRIWGGPYLYENDQICFVFINDTDKTLKMSAAYSLEAEIAGKWYEVYVYANGYNYNIEFEGIWLFALQKNNLPNLHPGKHRIVLGQYYSEFEIVDAGSILPKKPQTYDCQFLLSLNSYYSGQNLFSTEFYMNGLDVIRIEEQPINTANESIKFAIDLENIDMAYWLEFHLETRINDQWHILAVYGYDFYVNSKCYVSYPTTILWTSANSDLTLDKVLLTKVWNPAGPFPGTHRLSGRLKLKDGSIVSVFGEFEILDASDDNVAYASAWAWKGINSALAKGFIPVDLQNNYKDTITRAEFCRMAVKFLEYRARKAIDSILAEKGVFRDQSAFNDTDDPDILAAFALGITNGTGNNHFTPDGQLTREQAAMLIRNTCIILGIGIIDPPPSGFVDIGSASGWAVAGIDFCRLGGIMNGVGYDRFDPKGAYTREQSILTFDNIE